jgi:hypothetical protein
MPLLKCTECHHEWEGLKDSRCDWCGKDGKILVEKTGLEQMISDDDFWNKVVKIAKRIRQ